MKNKVQKYLKETVGLSADITKMQDEQLKKLPLYLEHAYHYYLFESEGQLLALAENNAAIFKTAGQLKKQSNAIRQYLGMPVVFVINNPSAQLKRKMIQERINFIVPESQVYLPELLISLKENGRQAQSFPELITPAAQLLLLYHLQVERLEKFTFKDIAQKLDYTPKTITKIAAELKTKNLCEIEGTKEKRFTFETERKQLWQLAEPQMQSPIAKSYYTHKKGDADFCQSGDLALSHYTFLSDTEKQDYAIYKTEFEALKEREYWEYLDETEGYVRIEVWKYNPRLLSNNGYIDPLSLYLCYRGDANERIEAEIKELIDKNIW
jgi:hypothetical protein